MRFAGEGILYVVTEQAGAYIRGADEDGWELRFCGSSRDGEI